mgnify:CR=1 FL=1
MKFQSIVRAVVLIVPVMLASVAIAQTYPAKSVRLVLPFAPGSAVDVLARHYAQKMSEQWKQQVDRKSTRLNSSHSQQSRMPSSA